MLFYYHLATPWYYHENYRKMQYLLVLVIKLCFLDLLFFWNNKSKDVSSLGINTETASYSVNNISLNCFISLQVGGVSVDFNSVEEFIFMILTYRLCCLRRISQLIAIFFLKFWWRKCSSDLLTKYSLNTCYVSGIMLFRGIWRLIKNINKVWLSELWGKKKRCINK